MQWGFLVTSNRSQARLASTRPRIGLKWGWGQRSRLAAPASSLQPHCWEHLWGCFKARRQPVLLLAGPGSKDWKGGSVPPLPLALLSFTKAKLSTAENPSQHVNHTAWVELLSRWSFHFLHLSEPDFFKKTRGMSYQFVDNLILKWSILDWKCPVAHNSRKQLQFAELKAHITYKIYTKGRRDHELLSDVTWQWYVHSTPKDKTAKSVFMSRKICCN